MCITVEEYEHRDVVLVKHFHQIFVTKPFASLLFLLQNNFMLILTRYGNVERSIWRNSPVCGIYLELNESLN